MTPPVTALQVSVLRAIYWSIRDRGMAPTNREVRTRLRVSPKTVCRAMRELVADGFLVRDQGGRRACAMTVRAGAVLTTHGVCQILRGAKCVRCGAEYFGARCPMCDQQEDETS